ncbi:MAG: hypothetical protein R3332_07025 [Pseudohongiellaceae bacterium]|nr:hypothetical protein [Pseudohongiellaceae bacterium]
MLSASQSPRWYCFIAFRLLLKIILAHRLAVNALYTATNAGVGAFVSANASLTQALEPTG